MHLFFRRSFSSPTGCYHDLILGSDLQSSFLTPGNTAIRQSMLGTSSSGAGLMIHFTHWSTLWVLYPSSSDSIHYSSPSHSKWITALLEFITMSNNTSSTGIPTAVITATNIYVYHAPCMFPIITCFVGPPMKLTGGRFTTGTGLSAYMFSFVNITTDRWSASSFTIYECDSKKTSVDTLSTSLLLHNSVALLYCGSMSHSHIILAGICHTVLLIFTATVRSATCVPHELH